MIDKIARQFVDICIKECEKDDNKRIIRDSILDPLIMHIISQIQPFIVATMVYGITTLVLIIILLILIVYPRA
jgi:hypothetical protein